MPVKATQSKTSVTKINAENPRGNASPSFRKQPESITPTGSSAQQSMLVPAAVIKQIKPDLFSLQLDRAKVEELAYLISQEGKTWDEYIWRLAEFELQLGPACGGKKNVFTHSGLPDQVLLHPTKVVKTPMEEDVRALAYEISQRGPSLQDLHWFIAQRQYICKQLPHLK